MCERHPRAINQHFSCCLVLLALCFTPMAFGQTVAQSDDSTTATDLHQYEQLLQQNPDALRTIAAAVHSNPDLLKQLTAATGDVAAEVAPPAVVPQKKTMEVTPPVLMASSATPTGAAHVEADAAATPAAASAATPPTDSDIDAHVNRNAFNAVKQEAFPLTPDQIKELHNLLDDAQRATAADPYDDAPEPTSSSTVVDLAPGSTPPIIRLARGFVTSLVFIDSTGAPWPLQAYDLGNPQAFDIQWNKKDNTLMVQARTGYTYGNLAVKLQQLDIPVMITLVPGQKMVDYRVDLRLHGFGPNAKPAIQGSGLPAQADLRLLSILDGIPPKGAKTLIVNGGDAEAWLLQEKIYFRSRFLVLSPAWISEMSSADGMHAYEMPKTPVVLVSRHGKTTQVRLEGF